MKKQVLSVFLLLLSLSAEAQITNFHLKNGEVVSYTASEIDFIDFRDETSGPIAPSTPSFDIPEMYNNFLGIITKMQAVGDKEILLTETRGELIEPGRAISELQALYCYETDLQDNPYANPQGYYEVITACNAYLQYMKNIRANDGTNADEWRKLVASTIRIKVWAYKTLAEIYGQDAWSDDLVTDISLQHPGGNVRLLSLGELVDACLNLMGQGFEGASSQGEVVWTELLDPDQTSIAASRYRQWNTMVPDYAGLYAELCLWKGAVLDAAGQASTAYYKTAADVLLQALGAKISSTSDPGTSVYWMPSAATAGRYAPIWNYAQPYPFETVSGIFYDTEYHQANTLLKHFSDELPNVRLLRPSQAGIERFLDQTFNPGVIANDTRYKCCFGTSADVPVLTKFRPKNSNVRPAHQDNVHIYIYRATQYHMMLCEALNHLQRFEAMNAVLNTGVRTADFQAGTPEWEGFESTVNPAVCDWTSNANWGMRKYPSAGIRGCFNLKERSVKTNVAELGQTATLKFNDMALLDESMLEFAGEGKVYPMMNRMAVRYNDPSIVADRVCLKYTDPDLAVSVRNCIMNGGYWVPHTLIAQ